MSEQNRDELIGLTQQLLDSVGSGDWDTYQKLCHPTLTCFEPESRGQLVEGIRFHKFYFDLGGHLGSHQSTIVSPRVRLLGNDAAVVSYVRLVQFVGGDERPRTDGFEETRVWHRENGNWRHVHFHRSPTT